MKPIEIKEVLAGSPAYQAGFEAGCKVVSVDGHAITDIIDWRWYTSDDEIEIEYIDLDGGRGKTALYRDDYSDWGFVFEDTIFDGIRQCRNACIFCFMRQLPPNMRDSLTIRDDDFRLSFLNGTFVTLTNATDDDIERIIEQRISPLRVSLHAVDGKVRETLMGKHAPRGFCAIERLLDAGIEMECQIVLVPGINDGKHLDDTLNWAYGHPNITNIAIVPLGFTRFQDRFDHSNDDSPSARRILEQVYPYQAHAIQERGYPWVYAADEFYRNAYADDELLKMLPDEGFYGTYEMFEDGIGMLRFAIDRFSEASKTDAGTNCARMLKERRVSAHIISGEATASIFNSLLSKTPMRGYVDVCASKNDFFGGNVNVTGLLTGKDIIETVNNLKENDPLHSCLQDDPHLAMRHIYLIFDVIFNCDGVTLDGMTFDDIQRLTAKDVYLISSNPLDYIQRITSIAKEL